MHSPRSIISHSTGMPYFFTVYGQKILVVEDLKVSKKHVFTQACNAAAFQCLMSVMIMVENRSIARPQKLMRYGIGCSCGSWSVAVVGHDFFFFSKKTLKKYKRRQDIIKC